MAAVVPTNVELGPRTLTVAPPLSNEELEQFCSANDGVRVERRKDGALVMNPPMGLQSGDANAEIIAQLRTWWKTNGRIGRVYTNESGFYLPDGSMLAPDAAYLTSAQYESVKTVTGFPSICPAFVIELLSKSDDRAVLDSKMRAWIANGAAEAWMVDPYSKHVVIYTAAGSRLEDKQYVQGSGPAESFVFDSHQVWDCFRF
jgi:Uma2 family endonuclease